MMQNSQAIVMMRRMYDGKLTNVIASLAVNLIRFLSQHLRICMKSRWKIYKEQSMLNT